MSKNIEQDEDEMLGGGKDSGVGGGLGVEMIAGLTAGFSATLVSHPLDFVKLRMQVDTTSKSQGEALRRIGRDLKAESAGPDGKIDGNRLIRNIYRGVGPNLVGSTAAWALYFVFYRQYKNMMLDALDKGHSDSNLNSGEYLMCAFGAGWTTSFATNPIWVIKTRMITTSRDQPGAYTSIWDGIKQIYKNEGIRGYYKGITPALFNVSQGALQFSAYDTFKNHLILKEGEHRELTTFEYLYASVMSKCIATITFYPLQVLRSRLQANSGSQLISARSLIRQTYQAEGLAGFYKGLVANLLRVMPATCITFAVYENVRAALT